MAMEEEGTCTDWHCDVDLGTEKKAIEVLSHNILVVTGRTPPITVSPGIFLEKRCDDSSD